MPDTPAQVYIEPGRREGRKLKGEPQFRAAIADGKAVVTSLNRVWFSVTINDADEVVYTALPRKPEGLE